jgi:ribonuclease Y
VLPTFGPVLTVGVALAAAAAVFAWWVASKKRIAAETVGRAEEQALRIVKEAERDAETGKKEALLEAKEKAHEVLMEAERQARQDRQHTATLEQTLARRDAALVERQTTNERFEKELSARERTVGDREKGAAAAAAKYDQLVAQQQHELERVASLTADEAKELLLKQIESEARHDAANLVKRLDTEARETAVDKAKHYITDAIQRCAAEHAIETTVSVVDLPSDDLKGRIIGREGRNIRALELATGVDLIVDDTPGAIILSGFDPYRREIAKQAIERLIADGRIHPARIEEVVQKVKDETDDAMRKEGASVAFELGLHDLDPEIHRLMGRLKYRTSYGQNVLAHSAEVARLAGIMARELGLDAHVAVRAAFLHDIGKAIDREMEGTHLQIGIEFLRKHGENEAVVMAMAAHHMDIDWPSLEAMIVQAADAISAARPGARRDILESYVKRLEKLEGIADSF